MSHNSSNDEGSVEFSRYDNEYSSDEDEEDEILSEADRNLFEAVTRNDVTAVQHARRNGANVNCSSNEYDCTTPLTLACYRGYDQVVRILLEYGANARFTAVGAAISGGQHVSTINLLCCSITTAAS